MTEPGDSDDGDLEHKLSTDDDKNNDNDNDNDKNNEPSRAALKLVMLEGLGLML